MKSAKTYHERVNAVTTLSTEAITTITHAAHGIDVLLSKLLQIKTAANNVRYRLADTGAVATLGIPVTYTDPGTGAEGVQFIGISETFYTGEQAAKYLNCKPAIIEAAITGNSLYAVTIGATRFIPEKALQMLEKK